MKITRKTIEHVALLARVKLNNDQKELFAVQLNKVLEYMERLNKLDTNGVEPTFHVSPSRNALREDEIQESLHKEISLDNAPEKTEGFFVVPKVI